MKKIQGIYLNDNERLVLVTEEGDQYQIDMDDFINPRWLKVEEWNVFHYDTEIAEDVSKLSDAGTKQEEDSETTNETEESGQTSGN